MTPLALALAAAALFGMARIAWWQARSPAKSRAWRLAALLALQPIVAGLLWLTLEPPRSTGTAGTLVVATAGAPRLAALTAGDALVALPEAPALSGAVRVPDLATALRTHPGTARLRIIGAGLVPRDRFDTGLPLEFEPSPLPRGLVSLALPPVAAPGAAFRFGGSVNDVKGGSVALVDPAGRTVATTLLPDSGDFTLSGMAGAAGPADFTLKITDRARQTVETAAIPVVAAESLPPNILVIAGAAGPDLKYLRRWATDSGNRIGTSIAAGNSLDVGDATPRLDAASLARLDLLVLDERSWTTISAGNRAAIITAVRAGLGLVLRIAGPVPDASRRDWAALGFRIDDAPAPVQLAAQTPALSRLGLAATRPDMAPLLTDAGGKPVGLWRGLGRGRIGLWPVTDVYALVLTGHADRHAAVWSAIFTAVARPSAQTPVRIGPAATPGERVGFCNLPGPASVVHPDGAITALVVDADCAAFWPRLSGWHELRTPAVTAFAVTAIGPARAAAEARNATLRLVSPHGAAIAAPGARGPSWPWFLVWVAASALLWWLERSRHGRAAAPVEPPGLPR